MTTITIGPAEWDKAREDMANHATLSATCPVAQGLLQRGYAYAVVDNKIATVYAIGPATEEGYGSVYRIFSDYLPITVREIVAAFDEGGAEIYATFDLHLDAHNAAVDYEN